MRTFCRICILVISIALVAVSCKERQSGVFPPGDGALRCSQDTLRFDTLFSTVSSTTAWMRIYNASDKDLTIDSVALASAGKSGYRVSVDALSLSESKRLPLPAGDSLFVFVELTPPRQQSDVPQSVVDELSFYYGESSLSVTLEACAWDAIMWKGKHITSDTVLTAVLPYVIYDSLVVAEGATLRIEPGVKLHFHDGATLMVYGSVQAEGSAEQPIWLRGDRLDWAFDDFPYEWYPGQWTGVYLGTDSYDNVFKHTQIRGAYYGIISDSSAVDKLKLSLSDSYIFNMAYTNLYAISTKMEVSNTVFANSGSYSLAIIGGDALFTHCTIANYQVLVSREENTPSLVLVNFTQGEDKSIQPYPLVQADFRNCIVYGSREEEIGFGLLEDYAHQVSFESCLIRSKSPLPEDVATNIIYNEDPHFKAVNKNYHYDFRIDSLSPAIDKADARYSADFPLDAAGVSRLSDEAPDLGAFEYVKGDF